MPPRLQAPRWQWALALFLLVLGFVAVLQFRAGRVIRRAFELPTLRVSELAALVRQQEGALAALDAEIQALRGKLSEYEVAAAQGRISTESLRREIAFYELVLGLTSVEGPGVVVRVTEEHRPGGVLPPRVQASDLSGIVNEVWAAGAEAVAVSGRRILATTGISADAEGISVGVFRLRPPYEIQAIGNVESLRGALSLRGGFVDGLTSVGVVVDLRDQERLTLPPYRGPLRFRHAVPLRP